MVGSLPAKLKKIKSNWQPSYLRYGCLPIDENIVLLEGGQGSNINGNMFVLAKELIKNPEFSEKRVVFVVTKQTLAKAKERFAFYGCQGVTFVVRNSKAYCKALATAKYLFTDNTFPPYFNKRKGQVYCNTWHGTPLKTLGLANKETLLSVNNIQKNYLQANYALFPNEFTKQVFMKDYALKDLFSGEYVMENYPRNGIFYNAEAGNHMKQTLGFSNKRLFAYMPTFRDAENPKEQLEKIRGLLTCWDGLLDDRSHLLINLHFVLASELNCEEWKHISYFPKEYETYDVLNACDGLVTDYSSVFFDYAVTRKPIVLFGYDKEEYLANRGTYFPLESLPFPLAVTPQEVMKALEENQGVPQSFLDTFCPVGEENQARALLQRVLGEEQEEATCCSVDQCLVYMGNMKKEYFESLNHLLSEDSHTRYLLAYRGTVTTELLSLANLWGERVSLLGLMNVFQFKPMEWLRLKLKKGKAFSKLQPFFSREAARLFGNRTFKRVVDFAGNHFAMAGILNCLGEEKQWISHSAYMPSFSSKGVQQKENAMGFAKVSHEEYENRRLQENEERLQSTAAACEFRPIFPLYFNFAKRMLCLSWFTVKAPFPIKGKEISLQAGETSIAFGYVGRKKARKKICGICKISLPYKKALELPAKSAVTAKIPHPLGGTLSVPVTYCALPRNKFLGLRGPMAKNEEKNTAVFRQSLENRLMIYVRSMNVTDKLWHRFKQTVAFGVSLLWRSQKAKKLVLLFEKNGEKYEESASVLYEELINSGYENAYFILTKNSAYHSRIDELYRKNIIKKYSFRHYLYFFKAKTFIGTEAVVHAIDLQTYNLLSLRKVGSKNMNYVFLQHGVMYMVSLDSESRGMFGRKRLKGKYRVVVSSKEEANHFTTLGGHLPQDMYITGLPKFDRNVHNKTADKIAIMPTWRPWEIAQAHVDFRSTGYCQMLINLYENLPEQLKEKAVILPHPLVSRQLETLPRELLSKMELTRPYDEILQETAVLITDYSSIAYDAFYRGVRVIFDWSQKDACMQAYGPSTKLMLHEGNVFGDVIMHPQELTTLLEQDEPPQKREEYEKRYARLVEFHDGNNTRRLMERLQKDGLI